MNVISIDIGGTKTEAVLYDGTGRAVRTFRTGSCHLMNAEEDIILEQLHQCILDENASIVVGYAGYARSEAMKKRIDSLCAQAFAGKKYHVISDVEMAVLGTLEGHDGVTAVLGTGSVVLKKKKDEIRMAGGWGYLLGDEGSGYAMGLAACQAFVKMADGRAVQDALYQTMQEQLDLEDPRMILSLTMKDGRPDRSWIASIAEIVLESTCESAQCIVEACAQDAADLIASIAEGSDQVVLTGGLTRSDRYVDAVQKALGNICTVKRAGHEPVYGGYIYQFIHS